MVQTDFVLYVCFDVLHGHEQSFVYTVQSFLGVFHEERGYNPNESLQLHFLEAVHLGVSGNVV